MASWIVEGPGATVTAPAGGEVGPASMLVPHTAVRVGAAPSASPAKPPSAPPPPDAPVLPLVPLVDPALAPIPPPEALPLPEPVLVPALAPAASLVPAVLPLAVPEVPPLPAPVPLVVPVLPAPAALPWLAQAATKTSKTAGNARPRARAGNARAQARRATRTPNRSERWAQPSPEYPTVSRSPPAFRSMRFPRSATAAPSYVGGGNEPAHPTGKLAHFGVTLKIEPMPSQ